MRGVVSIMFWSCVAARGTENIGQVYGRMDSSNYQQIQLKIDWLLQQNNDPKHFSKSTMDYYKKLHWNFWNGPHKSPDFNTIENLWVDIKHDAKWVKLRMLSILQVQLQWCVRVYSYVCIFVDKVL